MRGKCAPDGDNGDYVPFSELDVPGNGVEKRERENRKKTEGGRCEGGEREREREKREIYVYGFGGKKFGTCQLFNRSRCSLARYNVKILFRTSRFVETSVACRDSENNASFVGS